MRTAQWVLIPLILVFLFFGILFISTGLHVQAELDKMRYSISLGDEFGYGAALFILGMLMRWSFGIALILTGISLILGGFGEEDEYRKDDNRRPWEDNIQIPLTDVKRMKKKSED